MAVTSPRIVERLDGVSDIVYGYTAGLANLLLDPLLLQPTEIGFDDGVVPAVASSAHARFQMIPLAEPPPVVAAVLGALIGMDICIQGQLQPNPEPAQEFRLSSPDIGQNMADRLKRNIYLRSVDTGKTPDCNRAWGLRDVPSIAAAPLQPSLMCIGCQCPGRSHTRRSAVVAAVRGRQGSGAALRAASGQSDADALAPGDRCARRQGWPREIHATGRHSLPGRTQHQRGTDPTSGDAHRRSA